MPYSMKIQPIDFNDPQERLPKFDAAAKPILKSRFKRLFEKPFSSVLKASAAGDKITEPPHNCNKDGSEAFDPSSVCLAKMVQNFMEETNEKPKRCNCFNGNCTDSSDEEPDSYSSSFTHACDVLKSLVPCSCVSERNLLADTAKIVERNKINKRKDGCCRKIVADGLIGLGYNASICKSKWEKSPSSIAGEYEYLDVIIEGERLIIDIEFRSEFEIARSTKAYKLVLQTLPNIFVGKSDRLEKIIATVSDAAKQSLKKKGMPFPPWRKADYVKAKWLSPNFTRIGPKCNNFFKDDNGGEFELILAEKWSPVEKDEDGDSVFVFANISSNSSPIEDRDGGGVKCAKTPSVKIWELPDKSSANKGVKMVTGLASVIED
ncbi:hypothetical protein ACP275_04G034100 [Erythranthe tilingii]